MENTVLALLPLHFVFFGYLRLLTNIFEKIYITPKPVNLGNNEFIYSVFFQLFIGFVRPKSFDNGQFFRFDKSKSNANPSNFVRI